MNNNPFYFRYLERKFILTFMFAIASIIGLFIGKMPSSDFYLMAGVLLGGYAYNKKVQHDGYNKSGD